MATSHRNPRKLWSILQASRSMSLRTTGRNPVRPGPATRIVIVYPTWSNPPAPIDDAVAQYKGDNSQLLVPDAGLPAVTVPMGYWQDRLPVGLQFAGRPYSEGTLIELAYAYEQRTRHRRPPDGFGPVGPR